MLQNCRVHSIFKLIFFVGIPVRILIDNNKPTSRRTPKGRCICIFPEILVLARFEFGIAWIFRFSRQILVHGRGKVQLSQACWAHCRTCGTGKQTNRNEFCQTVCLFVNLAGHPEDNLVPSVQTKHMCSNNFKYRNRFIHFFICFIYFFKSKLLCRRLLQIPKPAN